MTAMGPVLRPGAHNMAATAVALTLSMMDCAMSTSTTTIMTTTTTTTIEPYEWFVGYWGECEDQCGRMQQKLREVYCHRKCSVYRCARVASEDCLNLGLARPSSSEQCSTMSAPCTTSTLPVTTTTRSTTTPATTALATTQVASGANWECLVSLGDVDPSECDTVTTACGTGCPCCRQPPAETSTTTSSGGAVTANSGSSSDAAAPPSQPPSEDSGGIWIVIVVVASGVLAAVALCISLAICRTSKKAARESELPQYVTHPPSKGPTAAWKPQDGDLSPSATDKFEAWMEYERMNASFSKPPTFEEFDLPGPGSARNVEGAKSDAGAVDPGRPPGWAEAEGSDSDSDLDPENMFDFASGVGADGEKFPQRRKTWAAGVGASDGMHSAEASGAESRFEGQKDRSDRGSSGREARHSKSKKSRNRESTSTSGTGESAPQAGSAPKADSKPKRPRTKAEERFDAPEEKEKPRKTRSSSGEHHTRGTAVPPRSPDADVPRGSRSANDASTPPPKASASPDSEGASPPAKPPDAGGTADSAAAEIIAKVDAELDAGMAKDLEWRRHHFKGLMLQWHPDKNHSMFATEVFRHVVARRARYLEA
eukprot:gnl/TRDRNA2_/TRDRNA2_86269_c0_seq1.p1 gnl/TRDRNA2_/TRDRNA2_86269_c0~~gnl/TRDRNA2_/TRDRNA2_86269_c0_seq1.p1  ORF type:complete len:597 (-),score=91.32 gnl/TRDRNA2_/TRDRNA2_86269_c0_seq1:252-2042(-)